MLNQMIRAVGAGVQTQRRSVQLSVAVCSASLLLAQSAFVHAQPTLEEVIVTAQKREQRLVDVPIAVTSLSEDSITSMNLFGVEDLVRVAPSLSTTNFAGGESFVSMRGISTAYVVAPAVAYYIEDMPLTIRSDAFSGQTNIELWDINRVEVLRGPQGTVFGDSALGGAIRVIPEKPSTEALGGRVEVEGSDTEDGESGYTLRAALNVPLSDRLAARFAVSERRAPGYVDLRRVNSYLNVTGDEPVIASNINRTDISSYRASLRWQPTDTLTIEPLLIYQENATEGIALANTANAGFAATGVQPGSLDVETTIASLRMEKSFESFDLVSVTGYLDKDTYALADFSELGEFLSLAILGQPQVFDDFQSQSPVTFEQVTQELRISSNGTGPLTWIAGVFYSEVDQTVGQIITSEPFASTLTGIPGFNNVLTYDGTASDQQIALFGEVTYSFAERWEATLGLRAYDFEQTLESVQTGVLAGAAQPEKKSSEDGLNPRVSVSYAFADDTNGYATASRGFRQGGPNAALVAAGECTFEDAYGASYDSDNVWNYELGFKTRALDGRLSFDAAVYQMDWEGVQAGVSSSCGQFVANIGDSRTRGLELESALQVTDWLSLTAGVSYNDAELDSVDPVLEGAGVGQPGDRIIDVPRLTYNVGASASFRIAGGAELFASSFFQFVGDMPTSYTQDGPEFEREEYTNLDINLGWRKSGFAVTVFGRNLTDQEQVLAIRESRFGNNQIIPNRPRSYGVRLGYEF